MLNRTVSERVAQKNKEIRKLHWPEVTDSMMWDRKKQDGFTTIPRTMPLIQKIMDVLADKGKPVSSVYFALWCRSFDEYVLKINNHNELAFESGFSGQRSLYTWKERMQKLVTLGFIKAIQDENKNFSYILLLNPYYVIELKKDDIPKVLLDSFKTRMIEVGATG